MNILHDLANLTDIFVHPISVASALKEFYGFFETYICGKEREFVVREDLSYHNNKAIGDLVVSCKKTDFVEILLVDELSKEMLVHLQSMVVKSKNNHEKTVSSDYLPHDPQNLLCVVISIQSIVKIEEASSLLNALQQDTSCSCWIDMLAIGNVGTVSYAVQVPSENSLNEFFLPTLSTIKKNPPPFYVVQIIQPLGGRTLNKVFDSIIARLVISFPKEFSESRKMLEEACSNLAFTQNGFQFDLSGELKAVPAHVYVNRHLPEYPFEILSDDGKSLAVVNFLEWQDGGVVVMEGSFPLEGFMLFFGRKEIATLLQIYPFGEKRFSNVLPISKFDFSQALTRFERQSNMKIVHRKPKLIFQKISDEGVQTPFQGRMRLGILSLREKVFTRRDQRLKFDELFDYLFSSLSEVRRSSVEIEKVWSTHCEKITSGSIVNYADGNFEVIESVSDEMRRQVETFLNAATRTMKQGLQKLLSEYGLEIGFLFQKEGSFESGLQGLISTDPQLADYIKSVRIWSEPLVQKRIELEHGSWKLANVGYRESAGKLTPIHPDISGLNAVQFCNYIYNRIACFVEEMIAFALNSELQQGLTVVEIKRHDRTLENPERFRVGANDGCNGWKPTVHVVDFDDV